MDKDIKLKYNYHTHCYLCNHAEGYPHDYIERAIKLGFRGIGISDHGPLRPEWTHRMSYDDFINIYLKDIDESINKYSDCIEIYKGLEIEYYEEYTFYYHTLLTKLDYLILGQHALKINGKIVDVFQKMTKEYIYEYANEVVEGLNSKCFKILAHPDLFMYKYDGKWDKDLELASRKIIEAAIKNDVYLELNVNGARRGLIKNFLGEDTWKYPYLDFWKLVTKYKETKVVINADCHKLDYLYDDVTEEVIDFAKKLNLNVIERLEL